MDRTFTFEEGRKKLLQLQWKELRLICFLDQEAVFTLGDKGTWRIHAASQEQKDALIQALSSPRP